jgi:hypothetical protein
MGVAERSETLEDLAMVCLFGLIEDCPDEARELQISSARNIVWY